MRSRGPPVFLRAATDSGRTTERERQKGGPLPRACSEAYNLVDGWRDSDWLLASGRFADKSFGPGFHTANDVHPPRAVEGGGQFGIAGFNCKFCKLLDQNSPVIDFGFRCNLQ